MNTLIIRHCSVSKRLRDFAERVAIEFVDDQDLATAVECGINSLLTIHVDGELLVTAGGAMSIQDIVDTIRSRLAELRRQPSVRGSEPLG